MIRIRAEINEIENKNSVEKVNENKSWLFETINKINMPLARWTRRKWQPTPAFLPGESQGRGSLVGCRLWGRTESDTTEAT